MRPRLSRGHDVKHYHSRIRNERKSPPPELVFEREMRREGEKSERATPNAKKDATPPERRKEAPREELTLALTSSTNLGRSSTYLSLIPSLILNFGTSVTTMSSSQAPAGAPSSPARSGEVGDRARDTAAAVDADDGEATKAAAGRRSDDAKRRTDFMLARWCTSLVNNTAAGNRL